MGEVWRAYDLKLRVEVALKTLTGELFTDERAFEHVRREVRAAREVVSPNVCRIFDLVEVDGHELVSMEYIDGATLLDVLRARGPLELREAGEIAAQFLAGLEAIRQAGLVHRDIKPENVMQTRAGRVVLMDFGIAARKADAASGDTIAGTPAYMAPEQQRREPVDARADVYAAGLVLAEMVCAEGLSDESTRQTLWKALRHDPPAIPESPWRRILLRAVAKDREQRFESAAALARALEEVALRVEGAEDKTPYPGLSSFQEEDTEFFFGREAEVESVWKKLEHATLLGIIGASGSGKSSFLRAGLIPARPEGWGHVLCQPESAPFATLGQALLRELQDDDEAVPELTGLEDPTLVLSAIGRWRKRHQQVLLIVDQFEELFTHNPPDVQRGFAELLARAAIEADVRVVLSMRDDFLIRCRDHESLTPIFSEMTALPSLRGSDLRRALIRPALACGYRFADEAMVEEMLAEVTKERGALPLIAFTAAQLWERRDRETGLLTREAYDGMGGVGGALAQYAEATLERIGRERQPIVRELFRNLVTAQGTRLSRGREELLSVFVSSSSSESRETARIVLQQLIDARLLTSYGSVRGEDETAGRRVEIVHESLLSAWPRLVRWRTQDAEGAQLRDELRQAAAVWDKHGRPDDLLWTGASYREFVVWRDRYPGGLTAIEEAFAGATVELAGRRTRRRRLVIASAFIVLASVLALVAGLWSRSETARREAVAEARRAEAARVFALGQLELRDYPSNALAYAIASLELADSPDVRRFALEALWRGPTAIRLERESPGTRGVAFSPDGRWLATSEFGGEIKLWPSDGGPPVALKGLERWVGWLQFGPDSDVLINRSGDVHGWSVPGGDPLWTLDVAHAVFLGDGRLMTIDANAERYVYETWKVEGERLEPLARWRWDDPPGGTKDLHTAGTWQAYADGGDIFLVPMSKSGQGEPILLGHQDGEVRSLQFHSPSDRIVTHTREGEIGVWSTAPDSWGARRSLGPRCDERPHLGRTGSTIATSCGAGGTGLALIDLEGPLGADAVDLAWTEWEVMGGDFHPSGRWVASTHRNGSVLWPLARKYSRVFPSDGEVAGVAFSPDGTWLAAGSFDGSVRVWGLAGGSVQDRLFDFPGDWFYRVAVDPAGGFVAATAGRGTGRVISLDDGAVRELSGFHAQVRAVAVGPRGRLVAMGGGSDGSGDAVVRVWDLESGEERVLDLGDGQMISELEFTSDGELLVANGGLWRWDPETGEREQLVERTVEEWRMDDAGPPESGRCVRRFDLAPDGRHLLSACRGRAWIDDLEQHESRPLLSHGSTVWAVAFDPTGTIVVTGDRDGIVRAGPVDGGAPHLLLGHERLIHDLAVSPDGRFIASAGDDKTARVWPMPQGTPFHTLPYEELIAVLRSLTNIRAVPDDDSETGYRLDVDPFPGWEKVPVW
jgi:WD40 repeat protein